jgi:hypothetical protein
LFKKSWNYFVKFEALFLYIPPNTAETTLRGNIECLLCVVTCCITECLCGPLDKGFHKNEGVETAVHEWLQMQVPVCTSTVSCASVEQVYQSAEENSDN